MTHQKGFTLIETTLYIGLFGIIIGGGMIAAYQIIQATDANRNQIILQEEANFLLRKIDWALTGATTITTTATRLKTIKPDLSSAQACLLFDINNGLRLQRFDQATCTVQFSSNVLNSSDITISNLVFADIPANNGQPHGVMIAFTLTTVQNSRNFTQNFSTTKYLRQ